MDLLTEGDLVQITKCGEQEFFSQPGQIQKINTEHATVIFSNHLTLEVPIDWVTKLPSKCGTYKGTVHTRDHLRKLAPELTSEEAGQLLSSYVTHYYSLPRHVHTIPAVEWYYGKDVSTNSGHSEDCTTQTAVPQIVLVEPRGHRPAHVFFVLSQPYATIFDPVTGFAMHTSVELNETRLLKKLIETPPQAKPKFPRLSQFEKGGALPIRTATFNSIIRVVSDRYYGLITTAKFKEVSNFWLKLVELPSKATLLSMVCGGTKLDVNGNLVPIKKIWEVVVVTSKQNKWFRWMFQNAGESNEKKRKRKTALQLMGTRVKATPSVVRQVLRADVSIIGHPLVRKLIDPLNPKCVISGGFIYIDPELIGYHADANNVLGVSQLLHDILDSKSRDQRLIDAFVSAKPSSEESAVVSGNKYAITDCDATTQYLRSTHRASARKKQKLDIATEVGSIRLEHAPPCVVACIDKDRPFKNTSRFQLASVIASVLPTASATDQKNLMDTLEAVVCHPENPNKHRWKEFVSALTCQQKKFGDVNRLPCVRRQGKCGQRSSPAELVKQNIDPGLMCPFNCSSDPIGSCLQTRNVPEKLKSRRPEQWRADEIWYLTTPK